MLGWGLGKHPLGIVNILQTLAGAYGWSLDKSGVVESS